MVLNQIRSMPTIYSKGSMYYSYDYHYDPEQPRKIFLEFNIACEAQCLTCYELKEDKGIFLLIVQEYLKTGIGGRKLDPECEVAGHTEKEAIEYMLRKIIEQPAKNIKDNGVDITILEQSLREVLLNKTV
jgi:hypothetical protein